MTNATTQEIQARLNELDNQIDWFEDKQGFASKALKEEFWALRAEIEKIENLLHNPKK